MNATDTQPRTGEEESVEAKVSLMREMTTLFRSARKVVSDNQALINDPSKGDKGLQAKAVQALAKVNYEESTGHPLPKTKEGTLAHAAQPLINEEGKGTLRYILPEYYGESCLKCHGGPKGSLDITGGKKEGCVLGELGGAISVGVYD